MAIDNYENLGFQVKIDGADTVETHLGKIVKRLKQIQQLNKVLGDIEKSASKGIGGGLSSKQKLTDEERWDKQYQDKMRKQAYYLKQGYIQQRNIISDHTKWVLAEEKKLEKKRFLTEQGYIQEKPKLTEEEQFRNSFEKSKRRREFGIQEGYIQEKQEKQVLSDVEKYLKRVNNEKDKLNDKTYEEARRIELANQQRKKEIDQRLKQELGIKKTTKSLGAYLGKLTAATVIAKKLGHLVVDAVNESAKYIENLNLFAVAFGDTYQQTLDWALDIADAYGLASNEVVRFAGVFRELSTSLGLVDKTADTVTKALTNYGYDLAALFNVSVEQAMEKLQSGIFSGNVRPLRAFGIDISQNQIDNLFKTNEALASMGVNARNLSQSDKVIARLVIALQSGTDAFGTMYREINNLQSQFRIFQGSLSNFKLAVGDLVQQPIADAMVYINAFIIAMTDIIRAFVPLKTIDETPVGNLGAEADEASEALDNLNGKLADFDKFNVLGGQSSGGSQLAVTEALNKLLEEQVALYDDRLTSAMEIATNQAKALSKSIIGWFIEVDEEGNILYKDDMPIWTENAKALGAGLAVLGGILAFKMIGSIGKFVISLFSVKNAMVSISTILAGTLIYSIIKAVEAFRDGDEATGILATSIGVLSGAVLTYIAVKKIEDIVNKQSTSSLLLTAIAYNKVRIAAAGLAVAGIGLLVSNVANLVSNWDELSNLQRVAGVFGAIGAAALTAAAAVAAFHNAWTVGTASVAIIGGLAAIIGAFATFKSQAEDLGELTKSAHANGGYTNANLIMTHENGKREWVGKAAGSSAIVNDTQMSDIMELAVAKGVNRALSARSAMGGNVQTNETIVVKIDEEPVFNAVRRVARRQGKDFLNL